jgi:hypothetical protein
MLQRTLSGLVAVNRDGFSLEGQSTAADPRCDLARLGVGNSDMIAPPSDYLLRGAPVAATERGP